MRIAYKPLVAACLLAAFGAAHADIKIGAIAPLSGGSAPMGESVIVGMRVAVEEINAKGGVLGQKLVLVERDDEAKNDNGLKLAKELIEQEKVQSFISFCNTGVALTALELIQNSKLPLVIPCAAGGPTMTSKFAEAEGGNYIFRVAANDLLQTRKVVSEALRRGITKVAILTDDTAYGKFGHDELVKAAKDLGVEVVSDEVFKIGVKDLTAQLANGKDKGAQAILTWGIGPELGVMAKDRAKVDFKVPMIGGWTLSMANFIDGAGKDGDGVSMPATFLQYSAKPGKQQAFLAKALKASGKDRLSSGPAAAQAYDSVYLLAAAMEQAKSTEGEKVKSALEKLAKPVEGVVKTYRKPWSRSNHEAQDDRSLGMGEIKDGKVYMLK